MENNNIQINLSNQEINAIILNNSKINNNNNNNEKNNISNLSTFNNKNTKKFLGNYFYQSKLNLEHILDFNKEKILQKFKK